MTRFGDLVDRIRSKNAGPFTVTLDVFCGSTEAFRMAKNELTKRSVAGIFHTRAEFVSRHELPDINVIKLSFPRPHVQGSRLDRDMHAAQFAVLLEELRVPDKLTAAIFRHRAASNAPADQP